jgi:hypothetical protein
MKKILPFIPLLFIVMACAAPAGPTPMPTETPNPGEIALQMVQQQMAAEATQQVVGLQFTATAQVMGQTATVQAYATQAAITQQARIDAQATADQALRFAQATQQRIDADATQAQARRDAEATSDQARLDLSATQQAQATSMAFGMTQMVMPTHNLWTQQAVEQEIIIATNEVELSNLAVQQQQQTNTLDWAVPMGIAAVLTVGLLAFVYSHSQVREVKDAEGNVQVLIYRNQQVVTPSLLPKPVLMLETSDMPDMTSLEEQSEIVRRKQGIEALAAMPVSPAGHGVQAFNDYFGQPEKREQPYEIVDGSSIPDELMDKEAMKAIETEWQEEGTRG